MIRGVLLAMLLPWPLVTSAETPAVEADGAVYAEQSQTRSLLWRYPVPSPTLADEGTASEEPTESALDGAELRKEIASARRRSEKIIDEYSRQLDQCRFNNTLHFDDRDQVRLIGNDQACQSRYWRLISDERDTLRRRISELRGVQVDDTLQPTLLSR